MANISTRQLELFNKFYSQYKSEADEFIDKYGAEAPKVMYGRAMKLAKNSLDKENKQKIKEMIKAALTRGPVEEIDSNLFLSNQKPSAPTPISVKKEKEKNPMDVIMVDVPLMIHLLEYAREDAKEDVDLHNVAENLIELSKNGKILNMDDYSSIVSPDEMTGND